MQRDQSRLRAEPDDGQEGGRQHQVLLPRKFGGIQDAARREICGDAVSIEEEKSGQGQTRSRYGVEEVLHGGAYGLLFLGVHHQRQGREGQQLVKEVERQEVRGIGDADQDAERREEEGEEAVLRRPALQVPEGVEGHDGPDHRNQNGEGFGELIHAEGQSQSLRRSPKRQGPVAGPRDGDENQQGVHEDDKCLVTMAMLVRTRTEEHERHTRDDGKQNRKDHERGQIHRRFTSLRSELPSRSPESETKTICRGLSLRGPGPTIECRRSIGPRRDERWSGRRVFSLSTLVFDSGFRPSAGIGAGDYPRTARP